MKAISCLPLGVCRHSHSLPVGGKTYLAIISHWGVLPSEECLRALKSFLPSLRGFTPSWSLFAVMETLVIFLMLFCRCKLTRDQPGTFLSAYCKNGWIGDQCPRTVFPDVHLSWQSLASWNYSTNAYRRYHVISILKTAVKIKPPLMGIFTINNYYKIQIHSSTFLLFMLLGWVQFFVCLFLFYWFLFSLQFPIHFVSSSNLVRWWYIYIFSSTIILYE